MPAFLSAGSSSTRLLLEKSTQFVTYTRDQAVMISLFLGNGAANSCTHHIGFIAERSRGEHLESDSRRIV